MRVFEDPDTEYISTDGLGWSMQVRLICAGPIEEAFLTLQSLLIRLWPSLEGTAVTVSLPDYIILKVLNLKFTNAVECTWPLVAAAQKRS
jgi:hypothetical protein